MKPHAKGNGRLDEFGWVYFPNISWWKWGWCRIDGGGGFDGVSGFSGEGGTDGVA